MREELVTQSVAMPRGELRILQPGDAADLPDDGAVEWAPIVPYWAVLWRSGVALARECDGATLQGRRVVELGCGLGLPSITAARAGASVVATDAEPDALELATRNAALNHVSVETARVDWNDPSELIERGPFDLAISADVLYERQAVAPLLALLPRLAPQTWLADPGRPGAHAFIEQARARWRVRSRDRGVVTIHTLEFPSDG